MLIKTFFRITLLVFIFSVNSAQAVLYYSQNNPNQSFADLSNWNTAANGSGASASAGDLTNGLNVFLIQNAHTVKIDTDIDVDRLIVGQGTTNAYLIIDGSAARTIQVRNAIYVDTRGYFNPDNTIAAHQILLSGANASITNLQNLRLAGVGSNTIPTTVEITSAATAGLAGNSQIQLYNLTINGGGVVIASGSVLNYGDVLVTNNSKLKGSGNIYARKTTTVNIGSEIAMSAGSFYADESSNQTLNCFGKCNFYSLILDNGSTPGIDGMKTVNGNIAVEYQLRIYDDASFVGSDSVKVRYLYIDNTDVAWLGSGPLSLIGSGYINTNGAEITLGTSEVIIDDNTYLSDNGTKIKLKNNLTVKEGKRLILYENTNVSQVVPNLNKFSLEAGALLYVRGVNNFPSGFNTFSLDATSRTFYDANITVQLVKSGISYGDLVISNKTKNGFGGGTVDVRGNLTVSNATTFRLLAGGSNLTLGGNVNGNGGALICNNTLTLNGVDKDQTLDRDVSYTFKDFVIENRGPITDVRTKNIDNDMKINGSFTITNNDGDLARYLVVDMDANAIDATGTFTVGDHVRIYTSGDTQFSDMVDATAPSFSTVTLSNSSTIQFDGGSNQKIPGITYGNVTFRSNSSKTLAGDVVINGDVDGNSSSYVFSDAGYTVTLYGNWDMGDGNNGLNRTNMTGNFIFAGGNQATNGSNFNNVIFGGTEKKSLNSTVDVGCTLTVEDGITVESDYNMLVGCDLVVNGTGKLKHAKNLFTFDGASNQVVSINNPKTSFVNNMSITNGGGSIILNSAFDVKGYLTMNNGTSSILDISDDTLSIGGDFIMYAEDNIVTTNSTIKFNGAADQTIYNRNTSSVYNNMYFLNGGEKRFTSNTMDINGDVIGESSVTINQNGIQFNVAGDWTHLGSIAGSTSNSIYFDGANQTITGSEFNSVYFAGTGTKTMGSNAYLKGELYILSGATLDVSPNNYQLTIGGNWNNDYAGYFESREGKIRFIGSNTYLYTGGVGAGKSFYDLHINLEASGRSVTLRDRNSDELDSGTDLDVNGEFLINKGRFYTSVYDVRIAGDLIVNSNGRFAGTSANHNLYFDGGAGVKNWKSSPYDNYRSVYFNAVGATWVLNTNVVRKLKKEPPHVQAHFILLVPHKIKRAFTAPPPPKLNGDFNAHLVRY